MLIVRLIWRQVLGQQRIVRQHEFRLGREPKCRQEFLPFRQPGDFGQSHVASPADLGGVAIPPPAHQSSRDHHQSETQRQDRPAARQPSRSSIDWHRLRGQGGLERTDPPCCLRCGEGAFRSVLLQSPLHDLHQRGGRVGAERRHRCRCSFEYGLPRRERVLAPEGQATGQHLEEDHAKRPNVGTGVHRFASDLLRRHVSNGANRRPIPGQSTGGLAVSGHDLCEAEIQDPVQGRPGPP